MEQISFLEDAPKSAYVRKVERALYEYPSLLAGLENKEEMESLYPSLISSYNETIRGSDISKPTEKYGIIRAEKELKLRQINRALSILSPEERKLIETKYFDPSQPTDVEVYMECGFSQRNYPRIKYRALRKVATALNII